MPSTPRPRYEIELWVNGVQVGDITKLAQNRKYVLTRNGSEQLSFEMDLTAFEKYCAAANRQPIATLEAYVTDIRVKRNGVYKFGTQCVDMQYNLKEGGVSIQVNATGFLDLFADRYVTVAYAATEATDIARGILALTQTGDPSNNFGITNGVSQYNTGVLRDRNYTDQNVRDALVNLTNLQDGNFDFRFNYDRTFETFQKVGSNRPGNKFTYPYNITSGSIPRTGANTFNYIIGIGSGFGNEAIRSEYPTNAGAADPTSRGNYKTRQKIVTFNSIKDQTTLDQNTTAYLQQTKDILMLPKINTTGRFCDLDIIGVGDRVPIEVTGHPAIPLSGTYRIEQISVDLDENDAEAIALTVDNYGL